jgi:CRISPR-associated protein (TIGR03984 family)
MSQSHRQIKPHPALFEKIAVGDMRRKNPAEWLLEQAHEYSLKWLLAHADDGVIWGRADSDRLVTSHEAARNYTHRRNVCPPLRIETLQQARLFAPHAELLLWREGSNEETWHAGLIRDAQNSDESAKARWTDAFDEAQMLWGTHGESLSDDFTLLRDGSQGLRHAVPLPLQLAADGKPNPPRLVVRHYICREGLARVVASRLVNLKEESMK